MIVSHINKFVLKNMKLDGFIKEEVIDNEGLQSLN